MFKTFIGIYPNMINQVKQICEDIAKRDPYFKYKIVNTKLPQFCNLLMIIGDDRKHNERRAGWFVHKCKNARMPNYFWTKEQER